jgi:hypothetical protein
MCTAGHSDLLHPTTMQRSYRPNLKMPSAASIPGAAVTGGEHNQQESRNKDDVLFSTTTVSSAHASPCKKKQHRERWFRMQRGTGSRFRTKEHQNQAPLLRFLSHLQHQQQHPIMELSSTKQGAYEVH